LPRFGRRILVHSDAVMSLAVLSGLGFFK